MSSLLRRLWSDDRGAVISTELVLVIGILIFGIIPGLVALRNSINAALGTIGNTLIDLTPSFTYSGYQIGGNATRPIAAVQGYEVDSIPAYYLTATQLAPIPLTTIAVLSPAP
jgi:Flp pilus assembly pilin Flp